MFFEIKTSGALPRAVAHWLNQLTSFVPRPTLNPSWAKSHSVVTQRFYKTAAMLSRRVCSRLLLSTGKAKRMTQDRFVVTSRTVPSVPMNAPTLYATGNSFQRKDNMMALEMLNMAFKDSDETQQFLDIGCAGGDFTHDVLLQKCGPCRRLVGTDISEAMVEYARSNHANPKLFYEVLDIAGDMSPFIDEYGHFDRVYSFYCLHWVKDQKRALANIASLMTPNGECLLVFCGKTVFYEVWRQFVQHDRWRRYKNAFEKFIPPSQYENDLRSYIEKLLAMARLQPHTCEVLHNSWVFPTEQRLRDTLLPVLPTLGDMEQGEKNAIFEDLYTRVLAMCSSHPDGISMDSFLYVVHASKLVR
ncbi:juvenile hormone acid O-methyltransferase-like isoform X1 [Ornithodoros turicata]|uniref:juvenile hormone acid O-methyltransferase-like isoform X1 n=1 Tax=Ornithodoros turicata TaxID=34597 RepID=UPI00313A3D8F